MKPGLPALDLITHSPEQTRRLGMHLGKLVEPGDILLLWGQIGAGKTLLTQGMARGLGVDDYVQSPTFTLAVEHDGKRSDGTPLTLYHIDLYRIDGPSDFDTFGYEDYLDDTAGVVVIEWPERLGTEIPEQYLLINIEYVADTKRKLTFYPRGERYTGRVSKLRREVYGAKGS